ncbi:MAG TPA: hypothetical protein VIX19_06600 [Terriglobales bacterium]
MPTIEQKPDGQHAITPEEYIRQNFEPTDRLAVVVIDRKEGKVLQRVETAETIAGPKLINPGFATRTPRARTSILRGIGGPESRSF